MQVRKRIKLTGQVQGAGFRPFVFRTARSFGIGGFVRNNGDGVLIEAEGAKVNEFCETLRCSSFDIEDLSTQLIPNQGDPQFNIIDSHSFRDGLTFLPADRATCRHCLDELEHKENHRHAYPFITCTKCGPRYSILTSLPFDRLHTSMNSFSQCSHCVREYQLTTDPRFHSQTNSCHTCGPTLSFFQSEKFISKGEGAIFSAAEAIQTGSVVCVKGTGGYHLLADASNSLAVSQLRKIKSRPDKPFAIMDLSCEHIERYCKVSSYERDLLEAKEAPIVLLEKRTGNFIDSDVAPGLTHLGVMLAYTGLHYLLLKVIGKPLIATSANPPGQGIYFHDSILSDPECKNFNSFTLTHNRVIVRPVEDSLLKPLENETFTILRRSRGFTPIPVKLSKPLNKACLAVGSHLKNAFAIGKGRHAILSQHIGDLDSFDSFERLRFCINDWLKLYQFSPERIIHDLHPTYASTILAKEISGELGVATYGVQHHHAHIASCIAEHQLEGPVIGIAMDGSGYGLDGTIWGGEFFVGPISHFKRIGHLLPFKLLGGDRAAKEIGRIALALTEMAGVDMRGISWPSKQQAAFKPLQSLLKSNLGGIMSSSCGRLFDGISALCGLCTHPSYEGQAAVLLEQAAYQNKDSIPSCYPLPLIFERENFCIDWRPMVKQIARDLADQVAVPLIAHKFHHSLVESIDKACNKIRDDFKLSRVVLSGGVFSNHLLLNGLRKKLSRSKFEVYFQQKFPCNDGGIALGQLLIAGHRKG